jgi:hypothetical protein
MLHGGVIQGHKVHAKFPENRSPGSKVEVGKHTYIQHGKCHMPSSTKKSELMSVQLTHCWYLLTALNTCINPFDHISRNMCQSSCRDDADNPLSDADYFEDTFRTHVLYENPITIRRHWIQKI